MGNKRSTDAYTISNLELQIIIDAAYNEHFAEQEYMEVFAIIDAAVNEDFSEEEDEDIFAFDEESDNEVWNIINRFLDENEDLVNELAKEPYMDNNFVEENEEVNIYVDVHDNNVD